jgi:hypothetical protein
MRHNCPGSWNDSDMSFDFQEMLLDEIICPDQNLGVVADSAFPTTKEMRGRILTPLKDGELEKLDVSVQIGARAMNNAIISIRQAAEWGVGSLEKVYARLKLRLPYNQQLRAK